MIRDIATIAAISTAAVVGATYWLIDGAPMLAAALITSPFVN